MVTRTGGSVRRFNKELPVRKLLLLCLMFGWFYPLSVFTALGDTNNIALNQPVVASSVSADGGLKPATNAVDGKLSTRWSSLYSDPQWIYVDLGAAYSINRVKRNARSVNIRTRCLWEKIP